MRQVDVALVCLTLKDVESTNLVRSPGRSFPLPGILARVVFGLALFRKGPIPQARPKNSSANVRLFRRLAAFEHGVIDFPSDSVRYLTQIDYDFYTINCFVHDVVPELP